MLRMQCMTKRSIFETSVTAHSKNTKILTSLIPYVFVAPYVARQIVMSPITDVARGMRRVL